MNYRQVMQQALEALRFYADGRHEVTLTGFKNGQHIDWKSERSRLEKEGYSLSHESYNGHENFVEDGSRAYAALNALEAALAEQDDDLTAAWMAGAAEERKRAEQAQPGALLWDVTMPPEVAKWISANPPRIGVRR